MLFQLGNKVEAVKTMKEILDQYPSTFTDGMAAVAAMEYDLDPSCLERSKALYKEAEKQDPRYSDTKWLLDIRRWPPSLVEASARLRRFE